MERSFDDLGMYLGNLARVSKAQTRYLPLQDDSASTDFWCQIEPHAPFPALPGLNELEVTEPDARM